MKHPREEHLALFAGGDLGPFERWRVSRHLRACPECRAEVGHFEVLSKQPLSPTPALIAPVLRHKRV